MKNKFLDTIQDKLLLAILLLLILSTFRTCSTNSDLELVLKTNKKQSEQITQLQTEIELKADSEYLDLQLEKTTIQISNHILYNWNAVIRTKERPDDIMNEYIKQLKIINIKLKEYEKNKQNR